MTPVVNENVNRTPEQTENDKILDLVMTQAKDAAEAKEKASRLKLDFDFDGERLNWSCNIVDYLKAIKPSSSGDSKGMLLDLSSRFHVEINGKKYGYENSHVRGGGAWTAVRPLGEIR